MKSLAIPLLLVAALLAWSCHPEPDTVKLLDELAVSTNYDTEAAFNSYVTYTIPTDTIGLISNATNDTIITSPKYDLPRAVINAIKSDMNDRGYTATAADQNPDLGINVVVINDFSIFQQVVYPGNYYSGYYGYGSYYYYPYISTYTSNEATIVVELIDLKNKTTNNKVKVIWTAYMGDIIKAIDQTQQSVDGVHQAFAQSPYLKTGV